MKPGVYIPLLLIAAAAIALIFIILRKKSAHNTHRGNASMSSMKNRRIPASKPPVARHSGNSAVVTRRPAPGPTPEKIRELRTYAQNMIHDYEKRRENIAPMLIEMHIAEQRFSNAESADVLIKRSYWKSGGIRFLCEELLRRLESLSPDADVPTMRVDIYNSIIAPVRHELNSLKAKREALLKEPDRPDAQALFAQLPLKEVKMPAVISEQSVNALLQTVNANHSVLKNACGTEPSVFHPRQEALLNDLLALYESDDADILQPGEGDEPSAEACHAAMARLKALVSDLLNNHSLPI